MRRDRIALLVGGGPGWIAGFVYTQNAAWALSHLDDAPEIHLVVSPRGEDETLVRREIGLFPTHRASTARSPFRRAAAWGWNALRGRRCEDLEALVRRLSIDAVFPATASLGAGFPVRWAGWVPDLQHVRLPGYFSEDERLERDAVIGRLLADAPVVVTSSEDARSDVIAHFGCPPARVKALPFCTAPEETWFDPDPRAVCARYRLPSRFLMFPSQFWKHKNHRTLFEALRLLRERGFSDIVAVCTGAQFDYRHRAHFEELRALLRGAAIEDAVILPGLLPRSDQIQLMRAAAAIVQPSLFEGWSALLEDVRMLGKTAYASDLPVHREQDVPGVTYFEPENAAQMADLIARDWPGLEPGPDPVAEAEARAHAVRRSRDFGRRIREMLGFRDS